MATTTMMRLFDPIQFFDHVSKPRDVSHCFHLSTLVCRLGCLEFHSLNVSCNSVMIDSSSTATASAFS